MGEVLGIIKGLINPKSGYELDCTDYDHLSGFEIDYIEVPGSDTKVMFFDQIKQVVKQISAGAYHVLILTESNEQ